MLHNFYFYFDIGQHHAAAVHASIRCEAHILEPIQIPICCKAAAAAFIFWHPSEQKATVITQARTLLINF
jgi:hypothetical protein